MRRCVAVREWVRAGDLVRIRCKLAPGAKAHRLGVYCKGAEYPDEDFSPYVDETALAAMGASSEPQMVKPLFKMLHGKTTRHTWEFVAPRALHVRVMQEVDSMDETGAIVRIRRHGKIAQAIERTVGKLGWLVGRRDAAPVGGG